MLDEDPGRLASLLRRVEMARCVFSEAMALVYKRSDSKTARAYERSRGMEPNPGVSHLTVVSNPGRKTSRRPRRNPFQWIEGRGQRHRHVSPEYETIKGAAGWKKRNTQSSARLYPVDQRGTIVSRPISPKLLSNGGSEMAYNIGALRRAMRSNPRGRRVSEEETSSGVKVSSRGKRRRSTGKKRRSTRRRKPTANRRRMTANRRRSRKTTANRRRRSRKPKANRRRSRRPRRNSRRRRSRRSSRAPRRNSRRRSRRPKRNATRGGKKRTSRRSSRRYHGRREVRARGKEYLDKYIQKGLMPTVAPRYRTGKSRSGTPPVLVYPIAAGQGRLSSRKTKRSTKSRSTSRKRTRATSVGASYRGRRARRMTANRRRRSRRPRRNSRRRRTRRNSRRRSRRSSRRKPGLYANRRRRSRRGTRRNSRRRRSRRVRPNILSTSKVRWGGRGKHRTGRPVGRSFQVLAYGPGSKTRRTSSGKRRRVTGYPVYMPGHVIQTAAVRRYRGLGGAAKDSHARAKARGYRERKRYPKKRVRKNSRRTSMRRNRRSSRRRSTRRNSRRRRTRRNPKYVVANRRRRSRRTTKNGRRRRVRRNQGIFGADLMSDVLKPVLGGTAGFVAARVLSNGLANMDAVRNILDKDKPAADARNTKIAANVLGIIATLGLSTKVKLVRDNQGALITGMGLALTDRLLGMVSGDAAAYLGGFGEYVTQPLGEYVTQPLGEYVSQPLGAYVADPGMGETLYAAAGLGGPVLEAAAGLGAPVLEAAAGYMEGVDPANQAGVDHMMDRMEYATAGLGAEADASLQAMYAREQPPFASIQTPTDIARPVTHNMPYARPVPDSLVTPEGKGYAGGLFARNLFAGML